MPQWEDEINTWAQEYAGELPEQLSYDMINSNLDHADIIQAMLAENGIINVIDEINKMLSEGNFKERIWFKQK